jgi:hypothetical protein
MFLAVVYLRSLPRLHEMKVFDEVLRTGGVTLYRCPLNALMSVPAFPLAQMRG